MDTNIVIGTGGVKMGATAANITITAGAGAGPNSTVTAAGWQNVGTISATVSSAIASTTLCTLTFTDAFSNTPVMVITPSNTAAILAWGTTILPSPVGSTSFSLTTGSTAPSADTYSFSYVVWGN